MADNVNTSVASRTFGDFLIPGYPFLTRNMTIASGQNIVARQLLALSGTELVACEDSNTGYAIAVKDVDATLGAKTTSVYVMGVFNGNKLVIANTGLLMDDVYDTLRDLGIYLVDSVGA